MKPVYETSFPLMAKDVDFCGAWRPAGMFIAMQELGDIHGAMLGAGYFDLRAKGLAWVLTRTLLEIDRAPGIGDTVRARTWPGRMRHAVYPRYYVFEDEAGGLLARASSLWVLMDIAAREMVPGEKYGLPAFDGAPLPPPIGNPGGIPPIKGTEETALRPILVSDLDINRHVNNARYVDWLADCFPYEWHDKYRLERLTVHFASETRPEEQALTTRLVRDGLAFTFGGVRDGHPHFAMGGHFTAR